MWQVYQNKANWYFHHKALNRKLWTNTYFVVSYHLRQNIRGGKLSQLQEKTPFAGKV